MIYPHRGRGPSPAVRGIGRSRRVRLPQGGPHRALSAGVRRSASTDDDDARGAAGWPRGESCHVAHGALLRARLRHRLSHARRLSGGSGGACGLGGSQGAPSSAAAVDPAASPVSNPAPASWEEILPGSRREGGVWARAVGRSTERSSGPGAPHLYIIGRARRPATSEGAFRRGRPSPRA